MTHLAPAWYPSRAFGRGTVLHDAFHRPSSTAARVVFTVVWVLIVVSAGLLAADLFLPPDFFLRGTLQRLDDAILVIFAVEVSLRILTFRPPSVDFYRHGVLSYVRAHVLGRLRFAFTPLILIDLLTVLGSVPLLRGLRALRLLRLLRSNQFFRYSNPFEGIWRAFEENRLLYVFGLTVLATSVLMGGLSFFLTESAANPNISSLPDALWWSIVTLTTVGYGDLTPVTGLGRVVAGLLMVVGMINLAIFAGIVGSTLMTSVLSMREESFRMSNYIDHIVICGFEPDQRMLLETLAEEHDLSHKTVVIFAPYQRPPDVSSQYLWVRGDPTKESELDKVRLVHASAVIVVASRELMPAQADAQTILIAFTIRRFLKRREPEMARRKKPLYIVAEVLDAENEEHARAAGANEVIETTRMGFSLLVHAVQVPGTATLVGELADVHGHSVYVGNLPRGLQGDRTFGSVSHELKQRFGVWMIGVRGTAGEDQLNPPLDYPMSVDDAAIYIATSSKLPSA